MSSPCGCPLCKIEKDVEQDEIKTILGASMMEPDIRIKTNEKGFCKNHFNMMMANGNRLSLALILKSHLEEYYREAFLKSKNALTKATDAKKTESYLQKLSNSCYICDRLDDFLNHIYECFFYLFKTDKDFINKIENADFICSNHFLKLINLSKKYLSKNEQKAFVKLLSEKNQQYVLSLIDDIDWFCKKFDYRFKDEPWKNSKDAIERTIKYL